MNRPVRTNRGCGGQTEQREKMSDVIEEQLLQKIAGKKRPRKVLDTMPIPQEGLPVNDMAPPSQQPKKRAKKSVRKLCIFKRTNKWSCYQDTSKPQFRAPNRPASPLKMAPMPILYTTVNGSQFGLPAQYTQTNQGSGLFFHIATWPHNRWPGPALPTILTRQDTFVAPQRVYATQALPGNSNMTTNQSDPVFPGFSTNENEVQERVLPEQFLGHKVVTHYASSEKTGNLLVFIWIVSAYIWKWLMNRSKAPQGPQKMTAVGVDCDDIYVSESEGEASNAAQSQSQSGSNDSGGDNLNEFERITYARPFEFESIENCDYLMLPGGPLDTFNATSNLPMELDPGKIL